MPEDDAPYWDKRYQQGNTGWDLGQVSPPLQAYFDQLATRELSILIPGCGNSYEAAYLLEKGFSNITLLDIPVVLMHRLESTFRHHRTNFFLRPRPRTAAGLCRSDVPAAAPRG